MPESATGVVVAFGAGSFVTRASVLEHPEADIANIAAVETMKRDFLFNVHAHSFESLTISVTSYALFILSKNVLLTPERAAGSQVLGQGRR